MFVPLVWASRAKNKMGHDAMDDFLFLSELK
jgi:hypothetical protein